MAEQVARFRQYEYRATSNLVLTSEAQRTHLDEPTGEPESLRGKLGGTRMGDRVVFSKPKALEESRKRKAEQIAALARKPAKRQTGASVLQSADDLGVYQPRTKESRVAYESLLAEIQHQLGDQPQDVLRGAADEVLACLKNDRLTDPQRKAQVERLVNTMQDDQFARVVDLGKRIADYFHDDAAGAAGKLDDDLGVAVVFDEEEDEPDGVDGDEQLDEDRLQLVDVDEEDEEGDGAQESAGANAGDAGGEAQALRAVERQRREAEGEEPSDVQGARVHGAAGLAGERLTAQQVDAHWLQRELGPLVSDPVERQRMSADVLECLLLEDERDAENQLMALFEFGTQHFDFIKMLLHNRFTVACCTRLAQAQSDDERAKVRAEMAARPDTAAVLAEVEAARVRTDDVFNETRQLEQRIRNEAKGLQRLKTAVAGPDGVGDEDGGGLGTAHERPQGSGAAAAVREPSVLDLEALKFDQGGHTMSNTVCQLPKGSTRTQHKGFEEVYIPPLQAPPPGPNEKLVPLDAMPEWTRPAFRGMRELNRIQSRVYRAALFDAENMLVCAPTGAGKTNVAMLTILHELGLHRSAEGSGVVPGRSDRASGDDGEDAEGASQRVPLHLDRFKVVYIAPMKALVQEVVANFSRRLEPYGVTVRELTGDVQLTKAQVAETQVIVTTPEKWDIVTRKSGERTFTQLVRLVIIDEIHLLHDDRGAVLEAIIARTLRQVEASLQMCRLVGISATLPNFLDVATLLRVTERGLFYFDNSYRPVPLQQQYVGITEKKAIRRFQVMNEICYDKCLAQAGKNQVLIFVHSRKETAKTAKAVRDMALENGTLGQFLVEDGASREILQQEAGACRSGELAELLPYGFAIHHAGMTRADRTMVEDLFADKHVQVLVSTATLAWGVNLPAHTVIIKGTQIYNPEKGAWVELSPLDIQQMVGRAGRPQHDTEGEGVLITTHKELQYYLSLLNQQLPIESQFIARLADNLNAEVVLGTVATVREAADWLGYTYLFIRMLQNPSLYGVPASEVRDDTLLDARRTDLAHTAATVLDRAGLVRYTRRTGQIQSTDLGRVAAHYYVGHETISLYNDFLKPTLTDIEVLRVFALSKEFAYMSVREEEKQELLKLVERVPVPVKEGIDEPTAKVNVLLQAYISGLRLDGFALASDMVYITQSANRLLRALHEIALKRGWAGLASKLLSMCLVVERRMWLAQTPLRQFRTRAGELLLPEDIIKKMEKKDFPWERLYDLKPNEIGELVRIPKMGAPIFSLVHKFPRVELAAHVQPLTRTVLRVELTVTPDFEYDFRVHGGAEPWHVQVEDADGEAILHHEIFLLKQKFASEEHTLTFTVPISDPLPPLYFVRAISDRWLGAEATLPISFRHLMLPEKYPPPTELLDRNPLPVTAVDAAHAPLFEGRFAYFNPIQTQSFTTLYRSDESVLVGAPTGSGKTVCAELAVLRMLAAYPPDAGARCVYLAPMPELAEERFADWEQSLGGRLGVRVVKLTGETASDLKLLERGQVVVATPQQWDVLSRRWKQRRNVQAVRLLVADELHLIGGEVGPTIEIVVSRARYVAAQIDKPIRIVGLSTSLANGRDLGEWIGAPADAIFNFHPSVRPVPLEVHMQGFDISHVPQRLLAMTRPTYHAVANYSSADKPAIVFVPSAKQAQLTAVDLLTNEDNDRSLQHDSHGGGGARSSRFLHVVDDELAPFLARIADEAVREFAQRGVGVIHEHMSDGDRTVVQALFTSGSISVCIVTRSLCWGLPLSAHLVVLVDTVYFSGADHRYLDYPLTEILQMIGRASRPLVDDTGRCVVLCHSSKKPYFKKFLYEPLPVESHVQHFLHDHFCAEVVTRTLENKQDAVDLLTWTFMYRRLTQNPNYYNLTGATHQHLSDFLSELVETTLADLEAARCIEISEDGMDVSPVNLGMIASYYYIGYATVELFASSLTATTKLAGLVEILSAAQEFSSMPVRHREDELVRALAMHCPLQLSEPVWSEPRTKVNVLLQCHFSRKALPRGLAHDLRPVLEKATRLLQAMVDVVSSSGWLRPALKCMELSQMATQALWDTDSPLRQLPHVTKEVADRCTARGAEGVLDLMDLEDDERNSLLQLSPGELADVARVCNRYPMVEVSYEVEDEDDIAAGDTVVVHVALQREAESAPHVYAPHYPRSKDEGWWLVVGDYEANSLVCVKRVMLQQQAKVKLDFVAPDAGTHEYKLFFMCDSWLGADQEYDIKLQVAEAEDEEDDGEDAEEKEEV